MHHHAWHRDAGRVAMAVEFILSARFGSSSSVMAELDSAYLFSTDPLRARLAKAFGGHELRTPDVRLAINTVEPRLGELADDRRIAKVTRAVAKSLAELDAPDESVRAIDASWFGFAHTAGKRAVIVGGDGRSERAATLKAAFQFERLDWPDIPKNGPNKASALISQVRKGHYHIVICLKPFIVHRLTDQLFDLDVPGTTAVLAQGYGVVQVKRALERYFPRPK